MEGKFITISNDAERISLVQIVAEAASNQAKVTNRLWLAVIVATVLMFLPPIPTTEASTATPTTEASSATSTTEANSAAVQLPFGLGPVTQSAFHPILFVVLSLLCVALSAAHAQHMRAGEFAHRLVGKLTEFKPGDSIKVPCHMRDMLDVIRHPGFTRVGPIAQVMTRHYHTDFGDSIKAKSGSRSGSWTLASSYVLMKLFPFVVLFLMPMAALIVSYIKVAKTLDGYLLAVITVIGLFALVCFAITTISDSIVVYRTAKDLGKKST